MELEHHGNGNRKVWLYSRSLANAFHESETSSRCVQNQAVVECGGSSFAAFYCVTHLHLDFSVFTSAATRLCSIFYRALQSYVLHILRVFRACKRLRPSKVALSGLGSRSFVALPAVPRLQPTFPLIFIRWSVFTESDHFDFLLILKHRTSTPAKWPDSHRFFVVLRQACQVGDLTSTIDATQLS